MNNSKPTSINQTKEPRTKSEVVERIAAAAIGGVVLGGIIGGAIGAPIGGIVGALLTELFRRIETTRRGE